jgi:hypothetical protein
LGTSAARAAIGAAAILVAVVGCSSDDGDDDGASTTEAPSGSEETTTTSTERPDGPAADITVELTGGDGAIVASPRPIEPVLEETGYVQEEYEASGTATAFVPETEPLPEDGQWTLAPGDEAEYRTRVVVRRPADPADASGTVVVEWLNVSGGLDADPDWQSLQEELTRQGHVWVGVSAQLIGINGGPIAVTTPQAEAAGAGQGIRNLDPARYGELDHPGDGFSFDIYTQVARAIRAGGDFLGGSDVEHVIAVGESQSAFALVTYINGVQPQTLAFDGFFVHSRGSGGLPITTEPGAGAGIADSIGGSVTTYRADTTVPVFTIQSETDVVGIFSSALVRQDDDDVFALWEVAGTAHADRHLVGEDNADALGCGAINDGPLHIVAKAGLRHLVEWVRSGTPPPSAPRLELTADPAPTLARDELGIALGGIRTPPVDVPIDVLSGAPGPSGAIVCLLSGSTVPIPPDALTGMYPSPDDYEQQFNEAADAAIEAGFVLEEDREALLAYADPARVLG